MKSITGTILTREDLIEDYKNFPVSMLRLEHFTYMRSGVVINDNIILFVDNLNKNKIKILRIVMERPKNN